MKSKKRAIILTLTLILLIGGLVSATLAYFTDTSVATDNTIVIGDVEIELYEDEYTYTADGAETAFKDVTAAQSIEEYHKWLGGNANVADEDGNTQGGTYVLPGYEVAKNTYLKNTGKNDAYVRFVVTVPEDLADYLILEFDKTQYDVVGEQGDTIYYATLKTKLAAGDFTPAGLLSVTLDPSLTEEQLPEAMQAVNGDRSFKINVVGQAVQTVGLESAETAFESTFDKAKG